MKNKILAMLSLTILIAFSCDEAQLIKPDLNGENLKSGLLGQGCQLADAAIDKIIITNVVGNTFDFTFRVTNQGNGTLHLNSMYFQLYLSEDALLDANDLPFRGSTFGDTAPALAFGEKFVQNWFYNPLTPVNLTKFNYVIVKVLVRPGFTMQECTLANNLAVGSIGCLLPDVVISNVTITHLDALSNTFEYTFTVTNTGWAPLPLSQMAFQTYVSPNELLGNGDDGAGGGADFGFPSSEPPILAKDESYTQAFYYSPSFPEDLTEYKYLIIQAIGKPSMGPECNTDNNTVATPIVLDIPRKGLIAFYPFSGNADDVSGNNLHGTVNGAALATDRFGNPGKSYSFDGVDDFITMGNPAKLQINDVITISAWIRVQAFKTTAQPFLSKLSYSGLQNPWAIGLNIAQDFNYLNSTPYFSFQYFSGNSAGTNLISSDTPLTVNTWTHFVLVLEHYTSKFYKNGVLINDSGYGGDVFTYGTQLGDWIVGSGETTGLAVPLSYFNGSIDDIAIYDRALTDAEVIQLFQQNISQ